MLKETRPSTTYAEAAKGQAQPKKARMESPPDDIQLLFQELQRKTTGGTERENFKRTLKAIADQIPEPEN